MPAHLVAKNAYIDDIVWVEEDPCFAKQALIHDINFMVPLLWKVYAFPIKKKKKVKYGIFKKKKKKKISTVFHLEGLNGLFFT